jgi:hypothetical protein
VLKSKIPWKQLSRNTLYKLTCALLFIAYFEEEIQGFQNNSSFPGDSRFSNILKSESALYMYKVRYLARNLLTGENAKYELRTYAVMKFWQLLKLVQANMFSDCLRHPCSSRTTFYILYCIVITKDTKFKDFYLYYRYTLEFLGVTTLETRLPTSRFP